MDWCRECTNSCNVRKPTFNCKVGAFFSIVAKRNLHFCSASAKNDDGAFGGGGRLAEQRRSALEKELYRWELTFLHPDVIHLPILSIHLSAYPSIQLMSSLDETRMVVLSEGGPKDSWCLHKTHPLSLVLGLSQL